MVAVDCKGFHIEEFEIPAFKLEEGEVITLNLYRDRCYHELKYKLISIFSGQESVERVIINEKLKFAEYIKINYWLVFFYPLTISQYLKKHGGITDIKLSSFPDDGLKSSTQISHLPRNPRKFLSIYAVLSKYKGLLFALTGVDPLGGETIYEIVKKIIRTKKGYAILLNDYSGWNEMFKKSFYVKMKE